MSNDTELDFAALLDDLIAVSREKEADGFTGPAPSLQVDLLEQIERLQSENLNLFKSSAAGAYADNGGAPPIQPAIDETPPHLQPALEDLFFLDPQSISKELGIGKKTRPEELDKARRAFAMRYHPDRMPEPLRERAALRMQIANMLIDEAKRRAR